MCLFNDILLEMRLLFEDADIGNVNNAISNLHPAKIQYDDGKGGEGKGERLIYPVAYGISTAGNPVVRAYQPYGDTKRGVPHWKFFKLANITKWDTEESEKFNPEELVGFNGKSDEQIATLYNISPIGNAKKIEREEPNETGTEKTTPSVITPNPILKKDIVGSDEYKNAQNDKYTANNAVNDILVGLKGKSVDNDTKSGDNENTGIQQYDTKPIMKNDIQNVGTVNIENGNEGGPSVRDATNEPIMKTDIGGSGKDDITDRYKDLMKRMDNLNNYENEEEK